MDKGIHQLTDEGVAQLFVRQQGNVKIVGTVGEMQFEVIKFRLLHEYGADCEMQSMNIYKAFWFTSANKEQLDRFQDLQSYHIAYDRDDHPVFLAEGTWSFKTAREMFPEIEFHYTSEFKTDLDIVQSIDQWAK
jgi:peptide chain release factor 3